MGGRLPGARRAGPFWGRGDPDPRALARIIVGAHCTWAEFLAFDDDLQQAVWEELSEPVTVAEVREPQPVVTSDPSSPFEGAFPVIRPGSPEFGALAVASGRGSF